VTAADALLAPAGITRGQREPDKIGSEGRVFNGVPGARIRVPDAGHDGECLPGLAADLQYERPRPLGLGRL
jgi:hypothetical protein